LAIEVEFAGWTRDKVLRFPSYRGLRDDVDPSAIKLTHVRSDTLASHENPGTAKGVAAAQRSVGDDELPAVPMGDLSQIHMTHPDRVMYPEVGVTKLGVATHYAQVAARILPHLMHRPLALVRCPKGCNEKCFFQKSRAKGMPNALSEVEVVTEGRKSQRALVVHDLVGVISLVQFSALEVHAWGCKVDRPDRPDRIILDLDPDESLPFARVTSAALMLRELLQELELETFVKTTGGKGLHVVLPIKRTLTWDEASRFALGIGKQMVARSPGRFTTSVSKAARRGKIYIDYLRNKFGATAIAPYSTRAKPTASVATPVEWAELTILSSAAAFTVTNLPRRLEHQARDPWAAMLTCQQTVTKAMLRVVDNVK
jgi:bifunctional non-homologous end joining protein LigD